MSKLSVVQPKDGDYDFHNDSVFRIDLGPNNSAISTAGTAEKILYGQPIRLIHVTSNSFLSALTPDRCALVPASSKDTPQCYFVLKPRYKIRSEGQPVYNGDRML